MQTTTFAFAIAVLLVIIAGLLVIAILFTSLVQILKDAGESIVELIGKILEVEVGTKHGKINLLLHGFAVVFFAVMTFSRTIPDIVEGFRSSDSGSNFIQLFGEFLVSCLLCFIASSLFDRFKKE